MLSFHVAMLIFSMMAVESQSLLLINLQAPPPAFITQVVSSRSRQEHLQLQQRKLENAYSNTACSSLMTSTAIQKDSPSSSQLSRQVEQGVRNNSKLKWTRDKVSRVVDANTVKLEKTGLVSFAAIQTPSASYNGAGGDYFPDCMSYTPAFKAKQLLPSKTPVRVLLVATKQSTSSSTSLPRALVIREEDDKFINTELVRVGVAKPSQGRGRHQVDELLPGIIDWDVLQKQAQTNQVGLYQRCNDDFLDKDDDQFEPLDRTVEVQYFSDGGKQVVKERSSRTTLQPANPGDTKGCSDFETYEDALQWFELYRPWYGDVAKLDPDRDGIPCPRLPHTSNQDRYRMKVPDSIKK